MPDYDTPPCQLGPNYFGIITARGGEGRRISYPITPLDVAYLAVAANFENGHEPQITIWCMIQRFVGFYRSRRNNYTLQALVESFSQPVNPGWAWINTEEAPCGQATVTGGTVTFPNARGQPPHPSGIPGRPTTSAIQGGCRALRLYDQNLYDEEGNRRGIGACQQRQLKRRGHINKLRDLHEGNRGGAWQSLKRNVIRAVIDICRGECGNSIPGWDDFASYRRTRITNLYEYDNPAERDRLLRAAAVSDPDNRQAVRFTQGGEWYLYRTTGRFGEVVITGPETNSEDAEIKAYPLEGARGQYRSSSRSSSSSSGRITDQTRSSAQSTDISQATFQVPPEEEVRRYLQTWGSETAETLSGVSGPEEVIG